MPVTMVEEASLMLNVRAGHEFVPSMWCDVCSLLQDVNIKVFEEPQLPCLCSHFDITFSWSGTICSSGNVIFPMPTTVYALQVSG